MPKTRDELFHFLDGLGIETTTAEHPPLFTVADSQALRGTISGAHTKNLFLKDKKDSFFLLTVEEEAVVDLKNIHHAIGAASRVSFGKPEALMDLLGVIPGAVSAFGLINDESHRVRFFLDETLAAAEGDHARVAALRTERHALAAPFLLLDGEDARFQRLDSAGPPPP